MRDIELDLGQPRFNLPGIISVYELSSPLHTNANNFISLFSERKWSKFIGQNNNFNCAQEYISASMSAIKYGI